MICLDTNILLRCITLDDPLQTPKALAFIKDAQSRGEDLYISDALVMEIAWVLKRKYAVDRERICDALEPLICDPLLRFDHPGRLMSALTLHRENPISLPDAYLVASAAETPGSKVATFDKAIQALPILTIQP